MRIAILDRNDVTQAFMDNDVPKALHYYSDTLHTYLQGAANTFSFSCGAKHADSQYLSVGNKVSFQYKNKDYYLNIVNVVRSETEYQVEAYAGSLELTNETVGAVTGTSLTFEEYMEKFISEKTLTVGINEVSAVKRTLEWTDEATLLARLFSLATEFDAELEFVPKLNSDYSLKAMVLNIYAEHSDSHQGIGCRRTDKRLRYGKEINGLTKTSDITGIYTAIRPTGTDDLNLKSYTHDDILDDDGKVLYNLKNGIIYAPQSRDAFPSNLMTDDRYIIMPWSYETSSQADLFGQALAELKSNCVPTVSYEVNGYIDADLGDTFTIIDDEMGLFLEARVTEQEISFSAPTGNKTTFDNFTEMKSAVSELTLSLVQKLISQNKTYTIDLLLSGTTLQAILKCNNKEVSLAEGQHLYWYIDGEKKTEFNDMTEINVEVGRNYDCRWEEEDDSISSE